jgi:hypothetical protein
VLAAEHLLDLGGLDLGLEGVDRALEISADILALLRPLDQHAEIVQLAYQRVAQLDLVREATPALQGLLRRRLILPEVRRRYARFDAGQLARRVSGVKDSSADLWRA